MASRRHAPPITPPSLFSHSDISLCLHVDHTNPNPNPPHKPTPEVVSECGRGRTEERGGCGCEREGGEEGCGFQQWPNPCIDKRNAPLSRGGSAPRLSMDAAAVCRTVVSFSFSFFAPYVIVPSPSQCSQCFCARPARGLGVSGQRRHHLTTPSYRLHSHTPDPNHPVGGSSSWTALAARREGPYRHLPVAVVLLGEALPHAQRAHPHLHRGRRRRACVEARDNPRGRSGFPSFSHATDRVSTGCSLVNRSRNPRRGQRALPALPSPPTAQGGGPSFRRRHEQRANVGHASHDAVWTLTAHEGPSPGSSPPAAAQHVRTVVQLLLPLL